MLQSQIVKNFPSHTIFPLGDTALTIDFGNRIDESLNRLVLSLFERLQQQPIEGMIEAVPAYSTLTIYYDPLLLRKKLLPGMHAFDWMSREAASRLETLAVIDDEMNEPVRVPVCYARKYAPDLEAMAEKKQMTTEELIAIHTGRLYRVYMLGFLPGFSYMGEVDERLATPRKSQPVRVAAGSVGIAGKQTGIYPVSCPGGWHIIGRTPLRLFDASRQEPVLLKAGDRIQFTSISKDEFESY